LVGENYLSTFDIKIKTPSRTPFVCGKDILVVRNPSMRSNNQKPTKKEVSDIIALCFRSVKVAQP